ncbi:MAG: glutamate-cysteine ligase family protein [Pseudomonadota bacterium]
MIGAFEAAGIEIEYMVVNPSTLKIESRVDELFLNMTGIDESDEVNLGPITLCNELCSHVLEFKCSNPEAPNENLIEEFKKAFLHVNQQLKKMDCVLLGGGMHPFLKESDPIRLWPYGQKDIYELYDKIFGCKGHGWSNVQSIHINFPFSSEKELIHVHAAIRVVLPFIPLFAASSPIVESKHTEVLDRRLHFYEKNQARIPQISGKVIPEPISSEAEYHALLESLYTAISPFDPERILQEEWLNSRGAIVRFDRNAIEIRVMDTQENPIQDVTLALFFFKLVEKVTVSYSAEKLLQLDIDQLKKSFDVLHISSDQNIELNKSLLQVFGIEKFSLSRQNLRQEIFNFVKSNLGKQTQENINNICVHGCLAERILQDIQLQNILEEQAILNTYKKVQTCVESMIFFKPGTL